MTDLRDDVGDFYEKMVRKDRGSATADGVAGLVLAPDYDVEELSDAKGAAADDSFGCGNPLAFSAVREGETVVDLGCGAGLDLLLAAERVGPTGRVVGIDMGEEMLARARQNLDRAGVENADLHRTHIENLPLEDASVDHVISNCVINLSTEKSAVFSEVARVLRPGGHMLVSDLVAEELPDWVLDNRDLYAACIGGAVSEAEYVELATGAGLTDVTVLDRLAYGAAELRVILGDLMPDELDALAKRLGTDRTQLIDLLAEAVAGKVRSIKVHARRAFGEAPIEG